MRNIRFDRVGWEHSDEPVEFEKKLLISNAILSHIVIPISR